MARRPLRVSRLRHNRNWHYLVALGIRGALARLLNNPSLKLTNITEEEATKQYERYRERDFDATDAEVYGLIPDEFAMALEEAEQRTPLGAFGVDIAKRESKGFTRRSMQPSFTQHLWKGVQFSLIAEIWYDYGESPSRQWFLTEALRESIIFEQCDFIIARCDHGKHWYISDDSRRIDCVKHRLAGQQARWRKRDLSRKQTSNRR